MRKDYLPDLKELSSFGWYISGLMTIEEVSSFCELAKKKKENSIDRQLSKYYRNNLRQLIKELIFKYPNRRKIIQEAVKAHEKRMYFSSIFFPAESHRLALCGGVDSALHETLTTVECRVPSETRRGKVPMPLLWQVAAVSGHWETLQRPMDKQLN